MIFRQLRPVGERVPLPACREWLAARCPASAEQLSALAEAAGSGTDRTYLWFDSGTAALAVALRAAADARCVSRPEVIVPAFACPDIVAAAVYAGIQPVLADFSCESTQLDPVDVAAAMSSRTVAVVAVRLLGLPGNNAAIRAAIGRDCALIEDAAHVLPHAAQDRQADALVVSFGRGKPVSLRRGGALIVPRDSRLHAHCRQPRLGIGGKINAALHVLQSALYNYAVSPAVYWWLTRGLRISVDAIAYRPLRQVRAFPEYLVGALHRTLLRPPLTADPLARIYERMLQDVAGPWRDLASPHSSAMAHSSEMVPADIPCSTLWRYPLLLPSAEQRDQLFDRLWLAGLGPSRLYRRTLSDIPETATRVRQRAHPNATSLADRLLTLPLHSDVTVDDIESIRRCLSEFAAEIVPNASGSDLTPLCT